MRSSLWGLQRPRHSGIDRREQNGCSLLSQKCREVLSLIPWNSLSRAAFYSLKPHINQNTWKKRCYCNWNLMVKVKVAQLCPPLCNLMDYTIHGLLQAEILEWVAFPFSRGSSQPRDWNRSPALQADSLPAELQRKPKNTGVGRLSLLQQIFNRTRVSCFAGRFFYQLSYHESPSDGQKTPILCIVNVTCFFIRQQV